MTSRPRPSQSPECSKHSVPISNIRYLDIADIEIGREQIQFDLDGIFPSLLPFTAVYTVVVNPYFGQVHVLRESEGEGDSYQIVLPALRHLIVQDVR